MTILDEIEVALTQKEALVAEISALTEPLQTKVQDIEGIILEKRKQLEEHLRRTKADKVHSTDGKWLFNRSVRNERVVKDIDRVKSYLTQNGLYDKYSRIDLVAVKSLSVKQEVPGIEVEQVERFTLTESTKGKKVEPEETRAQFQERVRKERGE